MVASSQCIQPECDFTGIQCTNAYYVPAEDECTKNFVTCTSGQLSSPIQLGTNMACLNGAAIPERNCQSIIDPFICHFTGIRCVGVDGMIWDDKETSHYILCNNGIVSQPIPVPSGSTCFNHQTILSTVMLPLSDVNLDSTNVSINMDLLSRTAVQTMHALARMELLQNLLQ